MGMPLEEGPLRPAMLVVQSMYGSSRETFTGNNGGFQRIVNIGKTATEQLLEGEERSVGE